MGNARYGRYEALHRIASGGMASVYLGRTRGPGGFERLVALKVMHDHISHDPAFGAMFLDEARLAARIRHPNVVPTLDVAEDGRYIVMEYVEGASLHAILSRLRKQDERLPLAIALRIFVDALSGLHAAHELTDAQGKPLQIVHRDVSPHNILVGVDGTSRITDFGIAHAQARITSTRGGELKGKLPYMAPEQLEDESLDRRTDVYAAGCVLWEILVGERLFKGGSEAATACAILAGPERSAREAGAEVPSTIDDACMQALGPRDGRFLSALAFSEAVERAAEASGIKIARHRDVGRFAQKTAVTFPAPASIMSGQHTPADTAADDEPQGDGPGEPMPPTLPAKQNGSTDAPPVTQPVTGPTAAPLTEPTAVTKAPSTADASTFPGGGSVAAEPPPTDEPPTRRASGPSRDSAESTLVTPAGTALPEGARTTAQDRPPPEVAAVIRAHYDEELRVRKSSPDASSDEDIEEAPNTAALLATSVGRPRTPAGSRLAVAFVAALAIVAGLWLSMSGSDTDEAPESERDVAAQTASEPSASVSPPDPGIEDEAADPDEAHGDAPSASSSASTAAPTPAPSPVVGGPLPSPAPVPSPAPKSAPKSPAPVPSPVPKSAPKPVPTGYHPAAP